YTGGHTYSSSNLHEEGTMSAAGAFSLSCVLYHMSGTSDFDRAEYQSQSSTETKVAAGNDSSSNSGLDPSVGNSGQSNGTKTTTSSGTSLSTSIGGGNFAYDVKEAGSYAGGSFSLGCVVLQENAGYAQQLTAQ